MSAVAEAATMPSTSCRRPSSSEVRPTDAVRGTDVVRGEAKWTCSLHETIAEKGARRQVCAGRIRQSSFNSWSVLVRVERHGVLD